MTGPAAHWRTRRGLRELDLLLQGYLDHAAANASAAEQRLFEQLLAKSDPQLWQLLTSPTETLPKDVGVLLEKIRHHHRP